MKRPAIPNPLRRQILMAARHRCVICRHFTVEIHHIVPFRETSEHKYKDLVALCPNCHAGADRGQIDRATLRRHKADAAASMLHKVVNILIDFEEVFDSRWGPSTRDDAQRAALLVNLQSRDMLAGVLSTITWPLVRCELCESLVSIDRSWTIQENCFAEHDERLDVYCEFGCTRKYQDYMRPLLKENPYIISE